MLNLKRASLAFHLLFWIVLFLYGLHLFDRSSLNSIFYFSSYHLKLTLILALLISILCGCVLSRSIKKLTTAAKLSTFFLIFFIPIFAKDLIVPLYVDSYDDHIEVDWFSFKAEILPIRRITRDISFEGPEILYGNHVIQHSDGTVRLSRIFPQEGVPLLWGMRYKARLRRYVSDLYVVDSPREYYKVEELLSASPLNSKFCFKECINKRAGMGSAGSDYYGWKQIYLDSKYSLSIDETNSNLISSKVGHENISYSVCLEPAPQFKINITDVKIEDAVCQ